jgi:hypothetical protein
MVSEAASNGAERASDAAAPVAHDYEEVRGIVDLLTRSTRLGDTEGACLLAGTVPDLVEPPTSEVSSEALRRPCRTKYINLPPARI